MTKPLQERLRDGKNVLDQIHTALGRQPARVPAELERSFREVVVYRPEIDHWIELLEARAAARQLLDGLEGRADEEDRVLLNEAPVKYRHVRFLGVQAYLTTTWALADRITGMVGRVLCTPNAGFNRALPAQLVSHFVQKERKRTTAAVVFESVRLAFGWPIGISYAIRNHFVHDGAHATGTDFFEGPSAASGFRVSNNGWARVEEQAETVYGVERIYHRAGARWPAAPADDLRVVLTVCEQEMDDALGVLLGSACRSLLCHVGLMLGED